MNICEKYLLENVSLIDRDHGSYFVTFNRVPATNISFLRYIYIVLNERELILSGKCYDIIVEARKKVTAQTEINDY